MDLIAARTLKTAHFFANCAEAAGANDPDAFSRHIEAAIVFARSITFHLQKDLAHEPGFADWYTEQQRRLANSRISTFFLAQRNYILKRGSVAVRRIAYVSMTAEISVTASFTARVIRGAPWHRRSPRILIQDALRPVRERISRQKHRRDMAGEDRARAEQQRTSVQFMSTEIYFADAEWAATPAIPLLRSHLDLLDRIVHDASLRFSPSTLDGL